MASDRSAAKKAIKQTSDDDPELDAAFSSAHDLQLRLTQESNRHEEAMRKTDIGFLGRAFGGEKSAPTYIALLVTLLGLGGAFYCWFQVAGAQGTPSGAEMVEFWSKQVERALAFAAASVAYIFGRGGK